MVERYESALTEMLRNWKTMSSAEEEEAEEAAERFEASFYRFIEAFREWTEELNPPPGTIDELLELPTVQSLAERLPAPLLLNFETEAELIAERRMREKEENYD
ncbi:hypothetical protein [Paenibacillus methanolicus]|uniref:Uncharacterized protein n=1 Tax=Paenibacillus methanolicus TaxID=582686 RepID=A0A5S5BP22_9BACL|nr:hypothetical protein [Paenibacillus methanolicus]TYP68046.1 hypothetical protein BCM02_1205 [Paenibacillus methanolicus]